MESQQGLACPRHLPRQATRKRQALGGRKRAETRAAGWASNDLACFTTPLVYEGSLKRGTKHQHQALVALPSCPVTTYSRQSWRNPRSLGNGSTQRDPAHLQVVGDGALRHFRDVHQRQRAHRALAGALEAQAAREALLEDGKLWVAGVVHCGSSRAGSSVQEGPVQEEGKGRLYPFYQAHPPPGILQLLVRPSCRMSTSALLSAPHAHDPPGRPGREMAPTAPLASMLQAGRGGVGVGMVHAPPEQLGGELQAGRQGLGAACLLDCLPACLMQA